MRTVSGKKATGLRSTAPLVVCLLAGSLSVSAAADPIVPLNISGWIAGGGNTVELCAWPVTGACHWIEGPGDFCDRQGACHHNDRAPIIDVKIVSIWKNWTDSRAIVQVDGKLFTVNKSYTYIICKNKHIPLDEISFGDKGNIIKCGPDTKVTMGTSPSTPWGIEN